jgi:hypothetical protein
MIPPVILSKATKLSYERGISAVDFLILTGLLDEEEKRFTFYLLDPFNHFAFRGIMNAEMFPVRCSIVVNKSLAFFRRSFRIEHHLRGGITS